jgi:HEAT repeat protein
LERYSSAFSFKRQFRKWATENWWSEVIVQLAGITDQPVFTAKQVLASNPWLAYWCSIEDQPLDAEVQSLIEQKTVARLDSPKDEERFRVISELARMENPRTTSYLIIALGDTIARVQELASQTLIRLGEPSVNPLLDSLTSTTERTRWAATRVLGAIWHFPEVAKLGAEEITVRRLAAEALGIVGDDRAILPLIAALQDSDEGVRRNVAEALGKLGDRRAIEPLLSALKQSYAQAWSYESSTMAQALGALGEYAGGPLLAELRDSKAEIEG